MALQFHKQVASVSPQVGELASIVRFHEYFVQCTVHFKLQAL